MTQAILYESQSIQKIKWPSSDQAQYAKALLLPFCQGGVEPYIHNVKTEIYAIVCDDYVLPLSVNEKEYDNSYVASNYASIGYLKEQLDKKMRTLRPFIDLSLFFAGSFLKAIKINKIAIVNNFFFSTNLCPSLTTPQVQAITSCLVDQFPDHLIVFRSVHLLDGKKLYSSLKQSDYRLIKCRNVFTYDPRCKESLDHDVKRKKRADLQLIERMGYEIIDQKKVASSDISRILELYHLLYHIKHSALSPRYTEAYLSNAISHNLLKIIALKKNNKIEGVFGYYSLSGVFTDPFFGYDTHHPDKDKIYRMLSILSITEAEKLNTLAHFGTGGDNYKRQRGLQTQPEYVAIYDKHLPSFRRTIWSLSEKLMNRCIS